MNIATSTHLETENAAKKWENPVLSIRRRENASRRLRLEVRPAESTVSRGRSVNRFLLREEKEETLDSQETIRAKRLQLKALFEAGTN